MTPPQTTSVRRCSVLTATVLLLVAVAASLPSGARSSAIRPASSAASSDADASPLVPSSWQGASAAHSDVPASAAAGSAEVVRRKRTLLKLKPLIVLPVKVALGTGAKLVAGAKFGAKAVGLGSKALGVSLVGLKAVHKVAKVTVKAATALGVKAVLLNFLFQKINQVIDFKTRLLSNLDQRNRQQNAQFLSPVLPQSSSSLKAGSIGNKDNVSFNVAATASFAPAAGPAGNFVPAPDFVAADVSGFSTNPPSAAFVPGSDLIASPPPPPSSQVDLDGPPSDFVGTPTKFDSDPSTFGGAPTGFQGFQPSFASEPSGFAATNDDGSPSSETSF